MPNSCERVHTHSLLPGVLQQCIIYSLCCYAHLAIAECDNLEHEICEPSCTMGVSLLQQTLHINHVALSSQSGKVAVSKQTPPSRMSWAENAQVSHWALPAAVVFIILSIITCVVNSFPKEVWYAIRCRLRQEGRPGLPISQQYAESAREMDFETWYDLLPHSDDPVLYESGVDARPPLTYKRLRAFMISDEASLHRFGVGPTDRVCTMIPNGPEAAVCLFTLPLRCIYAPLNPALTEEEINFQLRDLPCHTLLVLAGADNHLAIRCCESLQGDCGVQVLEMERAISVCGIFTLQFHPKSTHHFDAVEKPSFAQRSDVALVLHTSGTTRKPKIVPLTHENLVVGALCVKSTLQRRRVDRCLNLMPLHNLHGISVNLLVTALSGASVVCTPGFKDFNETWFTDGLITWYSAMPTMHLSVAKSVERETEKGENSIKPLDFIRNCSAALIPALAERMEMLFDCIVLPTYATTESMPITSNPLPPYHRDLQSVGCASGPHVEMCLEGEKVTAATRMEAEICVSGACVMKGYETRPHMEEDPNIEGFTSDGMLRTGDRGYFDEHGYLSLTGRYKEVIHRGCDKISPEGVELACKRCPFVRDCLAFSVPHTQLGETVGLAIVLKAGIRYTQGIDMLAKLREDAISKGRLDERWAPECMLVLDDIPRAPSGKPMRMGLAQRAGIVALGTSKPDQAVAFDLRDDPAISIQAPTIPKQKPEACKNEKVERQDSLGFLRKLKPEEAEEEATINTMYGLSMILIVYRCLVQMGNTFEKAWWLELAVFAHAAPVACFLLLYGYREARVRHFVFGWGQIELALAALCAFRPLFVRLFYDFIYVCTGSSAHVLQPSATQTGEWLLIIAQGFLRAFIPPVIPVFSNTLKLDMLDYFLPFILQSRVLLLILHRVRIPAWVQCCVCILVVAKLCSSNVYESTEFQQYSIAGELHMYIFVVLGAYYGPKAMDRAVDFNAGLGTFARTVLRLGLACVFVSLCVLGGQGNPMVPNLTTLAHLQGDAVPPVDWISRDPGMFNIICFLEASIFLNVVWVGTLCCIVAPKVRPLEYLGKHALGAFLLAGPLAALWHSEGIQFWGVWVAPSIAALAPSFRGMESVLLVIDFLYITLACLTAGLFFSTLMYFAGRARAQLHHGVAA